MACEWNLEPGKEAVAQDMFEALYRRLSERGGNALYARLVASDLSKLPARGQAWYLAMGLSALVLLAYPLPRLGGIWLLFSGWGQFLPMLAAFACLGLGFLTWPGPPERYPATRVVPRERLRQLYTLTDQLCELLEAPRLDGIILTAEYNASVAQYGWQQRKVLFLGLPLWEMLEPQERLSLLGHEIGHLVSGDPLQLRLPATAVDILFRTGHAICPERLIPDTLVHGRVVIVEEMAVITVAQWLMIPVNLLLLGVAQGFWALGNVLLRLLWAESQRAEYRSDLFGLQAGGLDASRGLLEKSAAGELVQDAIRQRVTSRQQGPAGEVLALARQRWDALPERERERRRRLLLREEHRLDATHPATVSRWEMLQTQRAHVRQLQVPGKDWLALDQELDPFRAAIGSELLDGSGAEPRPATAAPALPMS